ncbi:glycosyltransferase family 2 protein [Idiomarina sp. 29L]|uniref:glycosyltransferase family A protein n=1 Tax=Idiomarina sp. 29L TaxID=2508877 RepID=UPI0010116C5C|nr:glycosyltransferase family A protein [Idiomarina sp. 29L]RXS43029.1 glycosyltransferase family 2 protein [Idiomarina sp. 29L]
MLLLLRLKNFILGRLYSINLSPKFIEDKAESIDLSQFEKGFCIKAIKKPFEISAVYRLSDESEFLTASVMSIASLVSEVIFVANNSDEATLRVIDKLMVYLKSVEVRAKLVFFNKEVANQGLNYKKDIRNGKISLSDYYNYCFSHATSEYVMKVDGTMIMLPQAKYEIEKKLKSNDFVQYRGISFFGRKMSYETYLYKNSMFKYVCGEYFERLNVNEVAKRKDIYRSRIHKRIYLHMKYYKIKYYLP